MSLSSLMLRPHRDRANVARALLRFVVAPSLKAYVFAYLYIVVPKAVTIAIRLARQNKVAEAPARILRSMRTALRPNKFPALAGRLVLLINTLEPVLYRAVRRGGVAAPRALAASTFVSSFIASLVTFPRFQHHVVAYGRHHSLDLTLLVATRAADTVVASGASRWAARWAAPVAGAGDGLLFMASSFLVMYAWFYYPERLPPAYRRWITQAAAMDDELVQMLRSIKHGTLVYGEEGPHAHLLEHYCERYGQDPGRGSTVTNVPLSCEVVHAFHGRSCEAHAAWRFARGFRFALKLYGGVNAAMLVVRGRRPWSAAVARAVRSTVRSASFLGAFIGLCWYGVCLARTRVLPRVFPAVPRERWDHTAAVAAGSLLCGASCFVETPQRRKELALFVAPRAVGTLVSTDPTPRNLRVESVVFAAGMAVLVACSRQDPAKVRGVFGKGLETVFSVRSYQ